MNEAVFKQVNYSLGNLLSFIELGQIGLPDIQRPFVWSNIKVRDLFDSMYRGYPIGYLLFWQNAFSDDAKQIGVEQKQKASSLLIVDGQQRLTSLYAVLRGIPVIRENFAAEKIAIAFNPLMAKFEVADAATRRDPSYIPNISALWGKDTNLVKFVNGYLADLKSVRDVSPEEEGAISDGITRLHGLLNYPFTALELSATIAEEQVADVFVRINSKGTPLNQADFILTLMSVFWDEGRTDLERFCREARAPGVGPSPYNHFITPGPDQLLRVAVALGFKRARLNYVYSILRGKDLETGEFSEERRDSQFEILKQTQARVVNLTHWQDFFKAIMLAGHRSWRTISSNAALVYTYALYLVGRTEYSVDEFRLRRVIARWFFMASLTARYSSSPESTMEFDLARLRDVKDADSFVRALDRVCDDTLTGDFWSITLPNDLATSSSRSPSLFAYYAALVLDDARVLFSKHKVVDLLDPAVQGKKSAIERHHLFPKNHLKKLGITELRETNQIANFALVEWNDNLDISDKAPSDYLPEYLGRFAQEELRQMYHWHALPDGWEHMSYQDFLARRRELMAQIIAEGYERLNPPPLEAGRPAPGVSIEELVSAGETLGVEFKSALRVNLHTGDEDTRIVHGVLKTIAGFLNTQGGTLIIGVSDDGLPVGIEVDRFANEDKMHQHLANLVKDRIGSHIALYLHSHFGEFQGKRVLIVECYRSNSPAFVKDGDAGRFYVRNGTTTIELSGDDERQFIASRFN